MANEILLGVNIDHCATLRQARYRDHAHTCGQMAEPDPLVFALAAERAGADGITVHLREDRRHIQERDVWRLRESLQTRMNLEMACTEPMVRLACELHPDAVCLVPENRQEVTTEGGLDVAGQKERVGEVVAALREAGIVVSLFIDAEPLQVETAAALGAPFIELHTGVFAHAYYAEPARRLALEALRLAADQALALGLQVNAGHGLSYVNVREVALLGRFHEFNIGHSIVSRALLDGVEVAVREMKARMRGVLR